MFQKLFKFLCKKKKITINMLSASTWQVVDYINCERVPLIGELIFLLKQNQYYAVKSIINYVDDEGVVVRTYHLVEPVDDKLVKPF